MEDRRLYTWGSSLVYERSVAWGRYMLESFTGELSIRAKKIRRTPTCAFKLLKTTENESENVFFQHIHFRKKQHLQNRAGQWTTKYLLLHGFKWHIGYRLEMVWTKRTKPMRTSQNPSPSLEFKNGTDVSLPHVLAIRPIPINPPFQCWLAAGIKTLWLSHVALQLWDGGTGDVG